MTTEVPYVPSEKLFKKAIEYLEIKKGDKVLDIGSGDGRVLFYASKKYPEAEFVGVERRVSLVLFSNIKKIILNRKNLTFIRENAHNHDLSEYNKIYMYLIPAFTDKLLLKKNDNFKKETCILSFHFPFGKKISSINKVTKYPVKYKGKEDNIYILTTK
jgi:16S rRNA A1518/A1519 N6-dimethyltransferase RsmA/KsgA/DIM1 with predicted DNA glycosylase/AP lyase activity